MQNSISKIIPAITFTLLSCANIIANDVLSSGNASIQVISSGENLYNLSFVYNGTAIPLLDSENPVYLEVTAKKVSGKYSSYTLTDDKLICQALIQTEHGSKFAVTDTYIAKGQGIFELQRKLDITAAASSDRYFNSLFGFQADANASKLDVDEYFVPGVWYKGNFTPEGHIPAGIPQADDTYFYYREDRITLPLVMFRKPASKLTIAIVHKDSKNETLVSDGNGIYTNEGYQFGALGIKRENNIVYETFLYPGSTAATRGGKGVRYHPVKTGIEHEYTLDITFSTTDSYATAVKQTYNRAFDLYNPTIYPVDLSYTYDGLIETLLTYYIPSVRLGGIYDMGGLPWDVNLLTFEVGIATYPMGFVGMQIATAYYLYREGIEKSNASTRLKGEDVLDSWANKVLTPLGFPKGWYDPDSKGGSGTFRDGNDMRNSAQGMESLIAAYCFGKRNGEDHPEWIDVCKKFGDWLVENQNEDGSYYFSYNWKARINNNKNHPATNTNKYLTSCTLRYLTELYIATGKEEYKTALLKAGDWCYANIHQLYVYAAGVIDNPQTIDSESGQMALNGFLSLYDLTKEKKWLDAAEQAATYTASWAYMFEIPVESDRTTDFACFPKNRSVVGQHLIAIGHAASDLGFAWSSFAYYRLYLITGEERYLHIARISAHDSKQSLNWDGTLYPGQAKGLQLEAFGVQVPRRTGGISSALNWNYAAHLDPMFRFKDAYGTPDLEEVEKLSWEERKRLDAVYSQVQSANYGQETNGIKTPDKGAFRIYPNPASASEAVFIDFSGDNHPAINELEIYNMEGVKIQGEKIPSDSSNYKLNLKKILSGQYLVTLKSTDKNLTEKLIIY